MKIDALTQDARMITHGLSISPQHAAEIQRAVGFATCAHRHQKRKYTGEPYVNHCIAVARLVAVSGADVATIIAAVLHDTIEDTEITFEDVRNHFGEKVAMLVMEVTSPATDADGGRDVRHQMNLAHLRKASPDACTIKLADIIDNTSTIHQRDPLFAITYINEKWNVVEALPHGSAKLRERCWNQLHDNLFAAKDTVYPLSPEPYRREDYFVQPSKEYSLDGCILAALKLDNGGAIMIAWSDGRWAHTNLGWDKLMQSYVLSEQELADAGIAKSS
jgi:hypothetical protein